MGPLWHQQQQTRPCGSGAALNWTLHAGGSGKRPVQLKAALSTKAFVEDKPITSVIFYFSNKVMSPFLLAWPVSQQPSQGLPSTVIRELKNALQETSPSLLFADWTNIGRVPCLHSYMYTQSEWFALSL